MIADSANYRSELLRIARQLDKWRAKGRVSTRDAFASERAIFVASYIVRKLWEANKLTERVKKLTMLVTTYPNRKSVTAGNWHRVDECFDLSKRRYTRRDVRFVCNQFIHSYIFVHVTNRAGGLHSVLVCSDRERNRTLLEVPIQRLASAFRRVANDWPKSSHWIFNAAIGDFEIANH